MKTVNILYFALLREERGTGEEAVETRAETPAQLYAELKGKHGFSLDLENMRVARNDAFCSAEERFEQGDTIAFLPPVAGG